MIQGIMGTGGVSFILVFIEGILSFFSPCVIPLIPVYMGYLAGNAKNVNEDGIITYERKKVFIHTLFFILGISFAFFILGISFTALGRFFGSNKLLFTRIGGVLIVLLGLFQLGIFDLKFLQREKKFHIDISNKKVNPFMALLMGFTFSFAWTPCVGPALSSVLIMASGAKTFVTGNLLVIVYAIGFLLPFLLLGLFTTRVMEFLKSKQKLLKYTIRAGGIVMIIMGVMTFTGWLNGVSGYLNSFGTSQQNIETDDSNTGSSEASADEKTSAIDFKLTDQYGKVHSLSDYRGKVVFLNFWATWCPPCNKEMPDIEALYKSYGLNSGEVVFLGVSNPKTNRYPNNQDVTKSEIISFLDNKGYTFPVLFDETGKTFSAYNVQVLPTTYMIDKEGKVFGYVPGMMTKDIMINAINQTLESTK